MKKMLLWALALGMCQIVWGQQIQVTPAMLQQAKQMGVSDSQINQVLSNAQDSRELNIPADTSLGRQSGIRQVVPPERTVSDTLSNSLLSIADADRVFGTEIFGNQRLSFEPNFNMPTPQGYVLSAGDQLLIELWGNSEASYTRTISPDGVISLPSVGVIFLSGQTVEQARKTIEEQMSAVYSEIKTGGINLRVSLGQIRSIRVNIAGEVMAPGTYTLPSLATLFNALYMAGGVNAIGSLRDIQVYRNNKCVARLDVYDYILNGKYEANITLEDNDMVIVGPYSNHVGISGKVKRERTFELKDGETLSDLIRYAGGFMGDAYTANVSVNRKADGNFYRMFTVEQQDFSDFPMRDGDSVSVGEVIDRYENRVSVRGAVWRPGDYQLDDTVRSVVSLVRKAQGLRQDEYFERGLIRRLKPDGTYQALSVDVPAVFSGQAPDIALENGDDLYIPYKTTLHEPYYVTVRGEVNGLKMEAGDDLLRRNIQSLQNGGDYVSESENQQKKGYRLDYMEGMSVADAILLAGGFKESASQTQILVVRRGKNPLSQEYDNRPAEEFQITLDHGLAFDQTGNSFELEPFDEIIVRRSPSFIPQRFVSINGEVVFRGGYNLKKNMRISELVKQAGGFTPYAYIRGAQLRRRLSEADLVKLEAKDQIIQNADGTDSLSTTMITDIPEYYLVGIDLEAAMENPGGQQDAFLQEGDELVIPSYMSTVRISGAVVYPNAVTYEKGKSLRKYIFNAGGYAQNARRRAYVIYANGQVETVRGAIFRRYPKIEPGCEIIVPIRTPRKGLGLAEIMSLASSTTSIAALINSMIK